MTGTSIGSLSLNIKPYNQPLHQLMTLSGNQGNSWQQANVDIGFDPNYLPKTTFQFVLQATVNGAVGM